MLSVQIGHSLDPILLKACRILFAGRPPKPNTLTLLGAFFGVVTSILIALDHVFVSALSLVVSGLFDLMDGAVARRTENITVFGGFLDSVLDRYTDLFIMCGIAVQFAQSGDRLNVLAALVATIGTAIIPYARARAEASRLTCTTGLLERPERMILLACGLFFNILPYVIILLAVLTHVTVVQRILEAKREAGRVTR